MGLPLLVLFDGSSSDKWTEYLVHKVSREGKRLFWLENVRSQRMNGLSLLYGGFAELFLILNSHLIEMTQ